MKLTVISSSQNILDQDGVTEVSAPTTEGMIGILPGHVNLVTSLQIGELRAKVDNKWIKIILNGGILQIANDQVTVLADEASLSEVLVKEEIEAAIERAEKQIASKLPAVELIELEKKLRYEKFKRDRITR
ncbi:MAG: ATP synthase F1 subunit epsilon [bacterium]